MRCDVLTHRHEVRARTHTRTPSTGREGHDVHDNPGRRTGGAMGNPPSHRQRLRTLAEGVLACYDLQGASLTLVSETANAVFHVAVPSGRPPRPGGPGRTSDGAEYALRLRPPGGHSTQPMVEELHWLLALRRDTDLIVPEPVPACDGTFIQAISDPDTPGLWHGVLFHWIPGERRTATLTPRDLERVGTCMARLHQHAAAFVPAQHPPI